MIELIQIVDLPAQLAATLHIDTPRAQMQAVMGPGIREVMAAAKHQGIGPTGPWFTHHLSVSAEAFNFDICVPVSAPVAAVGRVKGWQRPALKVARTVYHGDYAGLGRAWQAFDDAVKADGYRARDDLYECYLLGPESSADAALWRTELMRALIP